MLLFLLFTLFLPLEISRKEKGSYRDKLLLDISFALFYDCYIPYTTSLV